jgi:hypothetical protein
MEYEQQARSAHVADEAIRKHFREEDRRKEHVRLMWIAGAILAFGTLLAILLHDFGVF